MSELVAYEKLELIGNTAFAKVFQGVDLEGNRDVRIIEFGDGPIGYVKSDEAKWDSAIRSVQLKHQNIVKVLRPIQSHGWIVTEWFKTSFDPLKKPLSGEQAISLLRQMLEALREYHGLNIIHGALHPGAFLSDDGHSARLDYSPGMQICGEVWERSAHWAFAIPEIINPGLGIPGPASDFYSLGFCIASLVIGNSFFEQFPIDETTDESAKESWQICHSMPGESLLADHVRDQLPDSIRDTLIRMTQKSVDARPKSVNEILKRLPKKDRASGGSREPIKSDPKITPPSGPAVKRRWLLPACVFLALLTVFAGLIRWKLINDASSTPQTSSIRLDSTFLPKVTVRQDGKVIDGQNSVYKVTNDKPVTINADGYESIEVPALEPNALVPERILNPLKPILPTGYRPVVGCKIDVATQLPQQIENETLAVSKSPLVLTLISVPQKFTFGVSGSTFGNEVSATKIGLSGPYYISEHEITKWHHHEYEISKDPGFLGDTGEPQRPKVNIPWDVASDVCKWLGGRLPKETEWELAARGANDHGFPYPWGKTPLADNSAVLEMEPPEPKDVDAPTTDVSPFGVMHLLGNVREWCDDSPTSAERGTMPQSAGTQFKVVRGLSFKTAKSKEGLRITNRVFEDQSLPQPDIGFRLVIPLNIRFAN